MPDGLDTENMEVLADQYESHFQPQSHIFNADTIDRVDHISSRFLDLWLLEDANQPLEEVIVMIKIYLLERHLCMMELQIRFKKISLLRMLMV